MILLKLSSLLVFLTRGTRGQAIEHGHLSCSDTSCHVTCDYGFIPSGAHTVPVADSQEARCVYPVALVAGGFNKDWEHNEVYLSSTELYSMTGTNECNYTMPDLPVARRGMFGGWVGGVGVVCGGEDSEGNIGQECFQYNVEDNVWLYLQDLEVARSFAAADIVDGCLVVTGGDTELGPTDSVEIIGGEGCSWAHGDMSLARPRSGHCLVTVGEELVVVGGGPDNYGSTQIYNLLSGEWRNGSEARKDRALFDCSLLEVDGLRALVAAGNDFSPADLAEIYFPHNDTWVWTEGWMQKERTGGAMTVLGGRPTILGGYGGPYCCKEFHVEVESWDMNSGHWWTLHARNLLEGRKSLSVIPLASSLFPGCS